MSNRGARMRAVVVQCEKIVRVFALFGMASVAGRLG